MKAGSNEAVEVGMIVNGTPVTLVLPPRVTLVDALRGHLDLTGTHVGCEHGVCGMCTVLVDGEAARACLLFAVQLDGADVLTVEGLGTPGDLHPLQESFGRNHALQCGFCTPGFLMSAYDLLSRRPAVTADDLPAELSGVLCRCTGYRNIIAAVGEAQRAYPDGLPPPGNCAREVPRPTAEGPVRTTEQIVLPNEAPTVAVDVRTEITVPPDRVWPVLDDIPLLAGCLPGAALTEDLGDSRYAGQARVSVGPVKLTFHGLAHVVEHDRQAGRIRILAQGRDAGGAQTQAEVLLRTEASPAGTSLSASARIYLTGRIAQFGRALAGDVSRRMFEQFAAALAETAASGQLTSRSVPAPSALGLLCAAVAARVRKLLRRLTGR